MQKVNTKKSHTIRGIDKLDDADKAGTDESMKCTLILTEGDSAKALAIAGLSVVGRDYFGVFPLRGKLLNVRDLTTKRVSENQEISNLVKILGLKYGLKKGKDLQKDKEDSMKDLRYGRIMIFTDADVDGSHIKGLLMNLFATYWPELLTIPGFIISLATPIIKARKSKDTIQFFTMTEFNQWQQAIENMKAWEIKYYKGLGTSTSEEAKDYFTNFDSKNIMYLMAEEIEDEENGKLSIDKLELAFDKSRSDDRKMWLRTYNKDNIIEQSQKKVYYHEFIDKELIHFSDYDCKRSIPSLCDGLKPSLRKILFSCFKRKLKKEIKVAQLAGYVSENSAYHHGEQSLYEAIIGMAQNFVGSNNIELLEPKGQFGTRLASNGSDAASPRYIFTHLTELAFHIYNPLDNPLLTYNEDDGKKIEPEWYIPILPMILVNGTHGIGTGFSTLIPPHDPMIIVNNLLKMMEDKKTDKIKPWFRGFKGTVEYKGTNDYGSEMFSNHGTYKILDNTTVLIDELPIGRWTDDYKSFLETLLYDYKAPDNKKVKPCLMDFQNNCTEKSVNFVLKFKKDDLDELIKSEKFEDVLKLSDTRYTGYTNMHLYNNKGIVQKYDNTDEIMTEFYFVRLAYYQKRKDYILEQLKRELNIFESKIRFIEEFISGDIQIIQKEDEDIINQLEERGYPKFGREEEELNQSEEEKDNTHFSYDYLLNMRIRSLTKKKIEELKNSHENKLALFKDLDAKSDKQLWREDLDKFVEVYQKKKKEYDEMMNEKNEKIEKLKAEKKAKVTNKVVKKTN